MQPNVESGSYPEGISCAWQDCLTLVSKPGSAAKGLEDVFAFQVRIILKKFLYATASADLPHHISNGHAHATDTGFATHDARHLSYAVKLVHFWRPYWKLILARGRPDSCRLGRRG